MTQMLRRSLAATFATACALAPVAGCAADEPSSAPKSSASASASAPAPAGTATPATLLPPVDAYVRAVADKDLDALAGAFAEDALLVDVGRRFEGRAAIRRWAEAEVIGGALTVTGAVENRPGYQKLLVRFAPGGTGGFAAHYAFTVSGSAITKAELTYAN